MDRKAERKVGFLRRKKAKQNSKNKLLNRQKKEELKYKDVIKPGRDNNEY